MIDKQLGGQIDERLSYFIDERQLRTIDGRQCFKKLVGTEDDVKTVVFIKKSALKGSGFPGERSKYEYLGIILIDCSPPPKY